MEDCASGPRVAQRQLAMGLAQGAPTEAPAEDNRQGEPFRDTVFLDNLVADHDVHADRAEVRNDAHHDIQLVRRAFGCFPLARQRAPRAEAGVEALHGVHEAPAERRSPVPRHFSFFFLSVFRKQVRACITKKKMYVFTNGVASQVYYVF